MILSLFPHLSTHRIVDYTNDEGAMTFFQYEGLVAALAVSFCRFTIKTTGEALYVRLVLATLLGYLAFMRYDYWILTSVHACSYGQLLYAFFCERTKVDDSGSRKVKSVPNPYKDKIKKDSILQFLVQYGNLVLAVLSAQLAITYIIYSLFQPRAVYSFFQTRIYLLFLHPYILSTKPVNYLSSKLYENVLFLIPIAEILDAYNILTKFVQPKVLHVQMRHLLYVTVHIQVGMGFLGIGFLTREQERKNTLIRLENETPQVSIERNGNKATTNNDQGANAHADNVTKKFSRGAASFIMFSALPYMFQIIFYGGLNMYTYHCFKDELHRTIRLRGLFGLDGGRFVATATVETNYRSPGEYAMNVETVVSTVYDMVNGKLFSVPKLLLLPQIVAKQPMLLVKIFPFILLSDYIKSTVVAKLTSEVERINKKTQEIQSTRTRIEQFDLKNSDLIQRSGYGSISFTERKWVALTEEIQDLSIRGALINRSRMYFAWLQRNFIMMAVVDCALAKLILIGKIVSKDIFVYQRAIEDAIDLLLMKSRAESELASMATSVEVLKDLQVTWSKSEQRNLIKCSINDLQDAESGPQDVLAIKDLAYSRGAAAVQVDNLVIKPGIYAVTGANGSGKSTLFRLIVSCDTNKKNIDLDSSISINRLGSIGMPSSDVVEVSQNFYWPLFTIPVHWIYQNDYTADATNDAKREEMITRVEKELQALNFYQETQTGNAGETLDAADSAISLLRSALTEEKEDWFGDLSGGQKSKVELVRKVFLADECPKVLLIDETFAPLDPDSKSLVMRKLKEFCSNSIVLVIYHADVKMDEMGDEKKEDSCVPSSDFFDHNLHVENGVLSLKPVCMDSSE